MCRLFSLCTILPTAGRRVPFDKMKFSPCSCFRNMSLPEDNKLLSPLVRSCKDKRSIRLFYWGCAVYRLLFYGRAKHQPGLKLVPSTRFNCGAVLSWDKGKTCCLSLLQVPKPVDYSTQPWYAHRTTCFVSIKHSFKSTTFQFQHVQVLDG